jgi:hypothetical protein
MTTFCFDVYVVNIFVHGTLHWRLPQKLFCDCTTCTLSKQYIHNTLADVRPKMLTKNNLNSLYVHDVSSFDLRLQKIITVWASYAGCWGGIMQVDYALGGAQTVGLLRHAYY